MIIPRGYGIIYFNMDNSVFFGVIEMKKVLVLFGGVSSEHDVSVASAYYVLQNIPREQYEVLSVGITKAGEWLLFEGDSKLLPEDKWVNSGKCTKAVLSPDRSDGGLLIFREAGVEKVKIDVVFPVLHGKNGEDGTMQGFLQLSGIPYVGCDTLSSAMCMDKHITNCVADMAGIPQAKWTYITDYMYARSGEEFLKDSAEKLGFPIFVKPANAGSSVGISKAKDMDALREAMTLAFKHDRKVVLEECIVGTEVECAVLGNEKPMASVPGEIASCKEFYDYDAKYISESKTYIPARFDEDTLNRVRAEALRVYTALGCSGLTRVDFFLSDGGKKLLFNEANTIPGFTSISMYAKMMEKTGVPYGELIDRLIKLAIEKWER